MEENAKRNTESKMNERYEIKEERRNEERKKMKRKDRK
jgi:hypothetical protein